MWPCTMPLESFTGTCHCVKKRVYCITMCVYNTFCITSQYTIQVNMYMYQLQVLNFIQLLMSTLLINSLHYLVPSTRGSILITIEYHKLDQECTCISVHNRVGGGDNKS